jgi:hypothetical protein
MSGVLRVLKKSQSCGNIRDDKTHWIIFKQGSSYWKEDSHLQSQELRFASPRQSVVAMPIQSICCWQVCH